MQAKLCNLLNDSGLHDFLDYPTHMVSDEDIGIALCRKSLDLRCLLCFPALDDPMDAGGKSPEEKEGKVCL